MTQPDDDPMRFARRLHDEASCILHRAWEPLGAGDEKRYGELVRQAMAVFADAAWAAQRPDLGPQFLANRGLDLYPAEAPTKRLRPVPEASESAPSGSR